MKQQNLHKIIQKGVAFLHSVQEKNGNFLSLSSKDFNNFNNTISYYTTFSTSVILSSSLLIKESTKLKEVKDKAATFLLSQRSKYWSWNYWERNSNETKQMPYPDDLDDTFCALNALFLYNSKIIDGESLAHIVNILTVLEIKEGGPYKTWLVDKKAKKIWRDVDLAVNSNIAYFLYLNEIEIPNLSAFIESRVAKLNFSSPYYPSPFPIIYFISRFYKGKNKKKIINFLLNKKNTEGSFGNPLNTALAITSLLNLDFPHEKIESSIEYLLKNQRDGNWQAQGFCFDPAIDGEKFVAGSASLTTALCLEALTKYNNKTEKTEKINKKLEINQQKIYNKILIAVEKRFLGFDITFKKIAFDLIKKLTKNNNDQQILLLPYYFANSLEGYKNNISEKMIIQLGIGNIFGWIAYTIYDNFFDEEGDPKTLAVANIAFREAIKNFSNVLPDNKKYQIFVQQIFDQIDKANYWEMKNCRDINKFPNYGNYEKLAEKSLGHALGPLAILFSLGLDVESQDIKHFVKFFKHYLIARQLNDDAHDWEKDLKMGHINPVATLILQKTPKKSSHKNLQKFFWETTINEVSTLILQHVKKSKTALIKCAIIADKSIFEDVILKYEKIAIKTMEEKNETTKFLKTYKYD